MSIDSIQEIIYTEYSKFSKVAKEKRVFAQVGGNRSRDGGLTWWAIIKYLAQSGGPVWWSSMVG